MPKPVLLTLDDDPEVLRAVERDLRKRYADRYRIVRSDSGATALQSLETLKKRNEAAALFLVDQRMPEMTGLALLRRLNAAGHTIPSLLITGLPEPGVAEQARELGALDVLSKPIDWEKLLKLVAYAMQ